MLLEKKRACFSIRPHVALTLLVHGILALVMVQAPSVQAQNNSDWSAPINLGAAINSTASDQQPAISPDGLSLYFTSNRTGGLGGFDLYVSHRSSISHPWGSPVNLGLLNTTADEGNAVFSRDGRLLFFQSRRSGGPGGIDIWFTRRNNAQDDFDWQAPVVLGPTVNSTADDSGPAYFESEVPGTRQLYFGSTRSGGPGGADVYLSEQMADDSFSTATLVSELNSPSTENDPSIRRGGLEVIFQSNRTGSNGGSTDLWVATRPSALAAWSIPVNLPSTINTASAEQNAYLSADGSVLFFSSDRSGGSGGLDLHTTRRPTWSRTGSLNVSRDSHTSTLLPNGKVLVVGGNDSNGTLRSAELYDPANGTWSNTGNPVTDRAFHTATLLLNGKVLVAGGFSCAPPPQICFVRNDAELYDPSTGTWSGTGNLNNAREAHTATLLSNGKVLVVGGFGDTAELYDPISGTWSDTGRLNLDDTLVRPTATLMRSGKVLVAGGLLCNSNSCSNGTNIAKLYDPASGAWSSTGNLNTGRELHTATLLPNGKVLIAGGFIDTGFGTTTNSAELYDPDTGTWSITGNLNQGRAYHTATLLPTGQVLVAGGFFVQTLPNITDLAELYDPGTGTWSNTANLNIGRRFHPATLLFNGKVLIAGGNGFGAPNSAELYETGSNPIDYEQFFVRQHYLDFLNRDPDASGLAFWTHEITSCGTDQSCIEVKRINVSAAFFISIEFQQTGYLIYRIYKASYGNIPAAPVPVRLSEFLPDTQQIGQGVVVNQAGWEQVLENNKQAFAADFVARSRFTSAFPTSMTPAAFVDTLFANAGFTPAASDRISAVNEFGSATTTSDVAARARALRRVAENSTFAQQEFNRAFVLMQYFGYLRRNPDDPPESGLNFDGYNFWLTKLNQFNGNFVQAELVKAFLVSTEYRQRFGQP